MSDLFQKVSENALYVFGFFGIIVKIGRAHV